MQVLINYVVDWSGIGTMPWQKAGHWQGFNIAQIIASAKRGTVRKWVKPTEPMFIRPQKFHDDGNNADVPIVSLFRIERNGKLVHTASTRAAALREIAWRSWQEGQDGVEIVEFKRMALGIYGISKPQRYVAPWPKAKLDEFAKLYHSDMSMKDLEVHFDTAISNLGRKRAELGLRKRRGT